MDMKGGCSPQNIFKSRFLLSELVLDGNQNCYHHMRLGVEIAIVCLMKFKVGLIAGGMCPLQAGFRGQIPLKPPLKSRLSPSLSRAVPHPID